MTHELSIYSLQTKAIPKGTPKNWLKGGTLSKRALKARGSFLVIATHDDSDTYKKQFAQAMAMYSNPHTGYIDSTLYLTGEDGELYVAYWSVNNITCGFSNMLKTLSI